MQVKRIGNYVFSSFIGKGSFAEVYKGYHQTTKLDVAIKMLPRSRLPKEDGAMIEKEVSILFQLKHPNIVHLIDFQKTLNNYYLIFEYCKYGDLDKFIHDNYGGRVPEFQAQKIIQQIIEGIKFMKEQKIVHRDLKLANLLVTKDFVVKIADFGFARYVDEREMLFTSYVGTPLTMAPEILEHKKYSEKCDTWSLGIIFYQVIVGRLPFDPGRGATSHDLLNLIKRKQIEFPIELSISPSIKDLIRRMLVLDENKRMTFEEVFKHDWITGVYEVQDLTKVPSQDLNASVLLKSAYDQKRISDKINKDREKNRKLSANATDQNQIISVVIGNPQISPKGNDKNNQIPNINEQIQVEKQLQIIPKIIADKPEQSPSNKTNEIHITFEKIASNEEVKLNSIIDDEIVVSSDRVKWKEIYECLLISKIYELLEQKCDGIMEKMKKINNILLSKKTADVENSGILPVLIIMQMLGIIKETLQGNVNVINEVKKANLIDLQLKDFWDNFTKIQGLVSRFCGENTKIIDIYSELKAIYFEFFKKMEDEMIKLPIEKFKGFDADELLYDSLIHISENTALNEFLSEKKERLEQYTVVDLICEIILFKKTENWYELEIVHNDKVEKLLYDAGIKLKDLAESHVEYLNEKLTFDFKKLNDILQKEGNIKVIKSLRDQFALRINIKPIHDELENTFINKIKILHQEIKGRLNDLKE